MRVVLRASASAGVDEWVVNAMGTKACLVFRECREEGEGEGRRREDVDKSRERVVDG